MPSLIHLLDEQQPYPTTTSSLATNIIPPRANHDHHPQVQSSSRRCLSQVTECMYVFGTTLRQSAQNIQCPPLQKMSGLLHYSIRRRRESNYAAASIGSPSWRLMLLMICLLNLQLVVQLGMERCGADGSSGGCGANGSGWCTEQP